MQLDIVKNLPDFLLPDGKGNVYSYASCDMTVIDNRLVNVISFRQNKGIKEPLYCGELYIDAENNALVQARLEINPAYVRQATDMFIERKTRKWKITAQKEGGLYHFLQAVEWHLLHESYSWRSLF